MDFFYYFSSSNFFVTLRGTCELKMQLARRSLFRTTHPGKANGARLDKCHKRNGNNQATSAMCQALIRSAPQRRTIAAKMPNARKKSRAFGITGFCRKTGRWAIIPVRYWLG
jgi:hypothetical protein